MLKRKSTKKAGFYFKDALMNLGFVILLVGLAAPSFSDYLTTTEISSLRQDVQKILVDARREAYSRDKTVSICPLSRGHECSTDWSQGWVLFQDDGRGEGGVANDGLINGSENIIRAYHADGAIKVIVENSESHIGVDSISFSREGRPMENGKDSERKILITVCDTESTLKLARGLLLSNTGQVTLSRDYNNDGVHDATKNDAFENSLRCS